MYQNSFNRGLLILTNFKNFPIILLLFVFVMIPFSANAQTEQEERIKALEEKIEMLTDEISDLKSEKAREEKAAPDERIEALEEKLTIIAEEVNKIKSEASVVDESLELESIFGGAPGASKIYTKEGGLSLGGYGELAIGRIEEDDDNTLDAQRVIMYMGYKFNENIVFNSEIEFEHGTTSSNLDNDEGSVSVEFALLDFLIKDYFNLRGGLLLTPLGIVNELHEPTLFYGVNRPSVERQIIPSTSREGGFGAFGTFDLENAGSLTYRSYLMNSFDSRGFSASGNRGLRTKGNRARFNDVAFVNRVEYDPYPGLRIAGSMFIGNTGQNENVDNEGSALNGRSIDGLFQIYEADIQFQYRGLDLRTLAVWTFLDDAELINANLGYTDEESVGEEQFGWYIVGAYNILSETNFQSEYLRYFAPFVRYEYYDTQKEVPDGFASDPRNERQEFTVGVNYKPIPNVVIKADVQWLDNEAESAKNQFNFGLGYVF